VDRAEPPLAAAGRVFLLRIGLLLLELLQL
jgi:hypothetical protein